MKLIKRIVISTVAGILASTLIHVGAANASDNSDTPQQSFAQEQTQALAIYEKMAISDDPEQAYNNLTAEERTVFSTYFFPVSQEGSTHLTRVSGQSPVMSNQFFRSSIEAMEVVAASNSCWIANSKYTALGGYGNAIWDTWTEGTWCGSGGRVTTASFTHSWSTIAAIGWRDEGQIGSGSGIVNNEARMWSQRRMVLGIGGWDLQNAQPCNRLNGYGDGAYSQTWSCSIA